MMPVWLPIVLGGAVAFGVYRALTRPKAPPCSDRYPSPNRSRGRPAGPPIWIVLHSTEGCRKTDCGNVSARGIAEFFSNTSAKVSSHLVVDDKPACERCVPDTDRAWAAGAANDRGLQIEMVATAHWTRGGWEARARLLEASAALVGAWCERWKIPARYVGVDGIRQKRAGIVTHADVSKAFKVEGGHWDPGPGFPMVEFMAMVRKAASWP
jgi:N-acetyl-anhydromuramyl-L-alanine amidase AmpD